MRNLQVLQYKSSIDSVNILVFCLVQNNYFQIYWRFMKYLRVHKMYSTAATLKFYIYLTVHYYWHSLSFRWLLPWGPSWGGAGEHAGGAVARLHLTSGLSVPVWKPRVGPAHGLPWPPAGGRFCSWGGLLPLHEWVGIYFPKCWRSAFGYTVNIGIRKWSNLENFGQVEEKAEFRGSACSSGLQF